MVTAEIVEELPRDEVARLFAVGIATLDRWLFLGRLDQDLVINLDKLRNSPFTQARQLVEHGRARTLGLRSPVSG